MSETVTCPTCKRDWPRHGMCCTRQLCGKHYDDCRCLADDLNDELEKMMRERDRLREALHALCWHAIAWRSNGWVPATGALDDACELVGREALEMKP